VIYTYLLPCSGLARERLCAPGPSKINGHALFQLEFKLDADSIQTRGLTGSGQAANSGIWERRSKSRSAVKHDSFPSAKK
jgi:hypothetical protein